MQSLISLNWREIFVPENSLLEMVLRGSIMYLALFLLMRFIGRRHSGSMGVADILVVVLLADAAQNGMAGEYNTITEGLVLVLTILAWDFAIDWLGYHVPILRPLFDPPALCLIRNGVVQQPAMRREMITDEELLSFLRKAGVTSPAQVRIALLEMDGEVSVIKKKP